MPDTTAQDTKTTPDDRTRPAHRAPGTTNGPQTEPVPGPSMTAAELAARLQPVVKDATGVATLVPSLTTALSRLQLGRGPAPTENTDRDHADRSSGGSATDTSRDGVTVTLDGDTATAVLDITVTTAASVLATALAVHAAATRVLETTHPGRHTVTVNVLGLDSDGNPTSADAPETPTPTAEKTMP